MYETYIKQALPSRRYRELLGTAQSVFSSNNAFIIESILMLDSVNHYSWHHLIDQTSGRLIDPIRNTISAEAGNEIEGLFSETARMRNRIDHGYQITDEDGEQRLASKDREPPDQFVLTEDWLMPFIKKNELLSDMLHDPRRSAERQRTRHCIPI